MQGQIGRDPTDAGVSFLDLAYDRRGRLLPTATRFSELRAECTRGDTDASTEKRDETRGILGIADDRITLGSLADDDHVATDRTYLEDAEAGVLFYSWVVQLVPEEGGEVAREGRHDVIVSLSGAGPA